MKILVVSRGSAVFPETSWGADNQALETALLLSHVHGVTLVCRGLATSNRTDQGFKISTIKSKVKLNSRVRLFYFLKGLYLELLSTFRASKEIKKDRFDAVITFSNVSTIILRRIHPNIKLYYSMHDVLIIPGELGQVAYAERVEKFVRRILNFSLEITAVRCSNQILASSPIIIDQLEHCGIDKNKLNMCVPALRHDFLDKAKLLKMSNRSTKKQDRPYILTIGNLDGRKKMDTLIHAMKYLPDNLKLIVVGGGHKAPEYLRLIENSGLRNRVVLLGSVEMETLVSLYQNCEMVALASVQEGFPTIIVESLYLGKKFLFISDRSGGIQEFLRSESSPFFSLATFDVHAISDCIMHVLNTRVGVEPRLQAYNRIYASSLNSYLSRTFGIPEEIPAPMIDDAMALTA